MIVRSTSTAVPKYAVFAPSPGSVIFTGLSNVISVPTIPISMQLTTRLDDSENDGGQVLVVSLRVSGNSTSPSKDAVLPEIDSAAGNSTIISSDVPSADVMVMAKFVVTVVVPPPTTLFGITE